MKRLLLLTLLGLSLNGASVKAQGGCINLVVTKACFIIDATNLAHEVAFKYPALKRLLAQSDSVTSIAQEARNAFNKVQKGHRLFRDGMNRNLTPYLEMDKAEVLHQIQSEGHGFTVQLRNELLKEGGAFELDVSPPKPAERRHQRKIEMQSVETVYTTLGTLQQEFNKTQIELDTLGQMLGRARELQDVRAVHARISITRSRQKALADLLTIQEARLKTVKIASATAQESATLKRSEEVMEAFALLNKHGGFAGPTQ